MEVASDWVGVWVGVKAKPKTNGMRKTRINTDEHGNFFLRFPRQSALVCVPLQFDGSRFWVGEAVRVAGCGRSTAGIPWRAGMKGKPSTDETTNLRRMDDVLMGFVHRFQNTDNAIRAVHFNKLAIL